MRPGDICRVRATQAAFTHGSIVEVIAADENNHLARCRLIMGEFRLIRAEAWQNKYGGVAVNYKDLELLEKQP